MKKYVIALLVAIAIVGVIAPAFAVQITVGNTAAIGGTGEVSVSCPASGCVIDRISWVQDTSAPFDVTAVNVTWTPASSSATYVVYVIVEDSTNAIIASGSVEQAGSATQVSTIVPLDTAVQPENIYFVRVIITEK